MSSDYLPRNSPLVRRVTPWGAGQYRPCGSSLSGSRTLELTPPPGFSFSVLSPNSTMAAVPAAPRRLSSIPRHRPPPQTPPSAHCSFCRLRRRYLLFGAVPIACELLAHLIGSVSVARVFPPCLFGAISTTRLLISSPLTPRLRLLTAVLPAAPCNCVPSPAGLCRH